MEAGGGWESDNMSGSPGRIVLQWRPKSLQRSSSYKGARQAPSTSREYKRC